jgi:hypothetical protein
MPASRRSLVRGVATGQAAGTAAVPLALHVSARIAERDAEDFVYDATQLANALRDLANAIDPDGLPVCDPEVLLDGCQTTADIAGSRQLKTAVEATRRLRATFGDGIALVAVLPGPAMIAGRTGAAATAATETVLSLGKEFLAAGADLLIVQDVDEAPAGGLTTLANVARFHQAAALSNGGSRYGLPGTVPVGLEAPDSVPGVVVTPGTLARDTDIAVLRDWVTAVRG